MESVAPFQMPRRAHSFTEFCPIDENGSLDIIDESVQTSLLCTQCQQIRTWLQSKLYRLKNKGFIHTTRTFNHHASGRLLEEAHLHGCHLCTIIWNDFLGYGGPNYTGDTKKVLRKAKDLQIILKSTKSRPSSNYSLYLSAVMRSPYQTSSSLLLQLVENSGLSLKAAQPKTDNTTEESQEIVTHNAVENSTRGGLRHKVSQEVKSGLYTTTSPIKAVPVQHFSLPLKTLSPKVFQQITTWIQTCAASHNSCMAARTGALPTRLIDLQEIQQHHIVRVVKTPPIMDLKYATLSYCWGGKSKLQLHKSNASSLEAGVSVAALPKTIQDAAYFTAKLSLRWLWVDSLCIFQDSPEDMAHEIQSMYGIYQNCFISIAALDAKHSEEGLYAQRDPLLYANCEMARTSDGQALIIAPSSPDWQHSILSPLYTRGWVVQERILPPRTVILGRTVAWECRESGWTEFAGSIRACRPSMMKPSFYNMVTQSQGKQAGDAELTGIHSAWNGILLEYLKTNLTYKSDRLNAISAIISAIKTRTNWRNVAGLWVPFLFTELLWKRRSNAGVSHWTGIRPTWSWVSVECKITQFTASIVKRFAEIDVDDGSIDFFQGKSLTSHRDPITLRVSCVLMKLCEVQVDEQQSGSYSHRTFEEFSDVRMDDYTPDIEPIEDYPEYFLPFALLDFGDIVGLGVSRVKSFPNMFERKGFMTVKAFPKKVAKQILHFLEQQKKDTMYII